MKFVNLGLAALALSASAVLAAPAAADLKDDVARLGVRVLAEKFGVDGRVADRYLLHDRDIADLGPIFSTSYHTHRSVDDVWKLKEQGLGWGQIAHKLGMHPGTFNKLRKSGAFDRDRIWSSVLRERCGARESDLSDIKKRGGSLQDTIFAVLIAHKSGGSPTVIFDRYRKDHDWDRTVTAFKANSDDSDRRGPDRPSGHDVGQGKDEDDPSNGHDVGHGRGHGKDKGEEHGNGKGHGKGRGRGF